jgi:Tat protein secretion system quality control protein TatD with DNase activity
MKSYLSKGTFFMSSVQGSSLTNFPVVMHARPEADIMLDYLKQFLYKFKPLPYFAFAFLTRLTHDSLAAAASENGRLK